MGIKFFKNGCNGGGRGGKCLPEMGRKPGMGGWFYNGDGKFLKSLYIIARGVLTPLFYEEPLNCWIGDHATFDVLFYFMIIWIHTCQAVAL